MTKNFAENLLLEEHKINPAFTRNLYLWISFINNHQWEQRPFDYIILQLLSYTIEGRISRLMVSIPPQHGKSSFITEGFLSYILIHCPDEKIILASYTQDLATELGGNVKDIINYYGQYTEKKPRLRDDSQAKNKFKLERPHRGRMLARGTQGSITGFEANIVVVDDPFKDFEEAMSRTKQEKVIRWKDATAEMRLRHRSNGLPPIMIIIGQRLHEKDLHGKIQEKEPYIDAKEAITRLEQGETIPPHVWVNLNLESICTDPEKDPLGRQKGEVLWPNHRDYDNLMALRRSVGTYIFETEMQGHPPKEASYIFKYEWFYNQQGQLKCTVPYTPQLRNYPSGRFWDLAAQNDNKEEVDMNTGDYYSGTLAYKDYTTDIMYIMNNRRGKGLATDVVHLIKGTFLEDGEEMFTDIEQEGASHSLLFKAELIEQFPNHNISFHKPLVNKYARAFELKRLAEFGLLKFVQMPGESDEWIHTAVNELLSFDGKESNSSKGKHDDITDSFSMAATHFKLNKNYYV